MSDSATISSILDGAADEMYQASKHNHGEVGDLLRAAMSLGRADALLAQREPPPKHLERRLLGMRNRLFRMGRAIEDQLSDDGE